MDKLDISERIVKVRVFKEALLSLLRSQDTLDLAVQQNQWFSEYDIREAVSRLLPWFDEGKLESLAADYDFSEVEPQNVGIIMAGNVPMVGFHDLLLAILAGHRALVKYSGKDKVLLPWVLQKVFSLTPFIKGRVRAFSPKKKLDFLLATGSNNTARHLEFQFRDVPKLIRKNRFSVAILSGTESERDLRGLADDVFLYNGMGCRNASVLLLPVGFDLNYLFSLWNNLEGERFSAHYHDLMLRERAISGVEGGADYSCKWLLGLESDFLEAKGPGWLVCVRYENESDLAQKLASVQGDLQVVMGRDVPLGKGQSPKLTDFADGLDILKVLTEI